MNHKHSKCMFFREGTVLDETCDKTIAHCFCDLDEMEEDKPCTSAPAATTCDRRKGSRNEPRK